MNYRSFEKVFKRFGIVSTSQVKATNLVFDKNNFGRWEKQGLLIKLKNGYYAFADIASTQGFAHYAAGKIYKPSYISLGTALAFHGITPETTNDIASVSSLKTSTFENSLGTFSYKKIKPSLMFGYNAMEKNGFTFFMASPEKAILDLLYLYPFYKSEEEMRNLRLNDYFMQNNLDWNKLTAFAKEFKKQVILEKIALLKKIFLEDI
jgi:predicted transcriptional regulator of viral defense system